MFLCGPPRIIRCGQQILFVLAVSFQVEDATARILGGRAGFIEVNLHHRTGNLFAVDCQCGIVNSHQGSVNRADIGNVLDLDHHFVFRPDPLENIQIEGSDIIVPFKRLTPQNFAVDADSFFSRHAAPLLCRAVVVINKHQGKMG